ncbi:MAG TPA: hypothetical protein VK204_09580 [Nocardioidaceae bacterium]|nr:hypothetical protein [Nocardioidaceae bacterium]
MSTDPQRALEQIVAAVRRTTVDRTGAHTAGVDAGGEALEALSALRDLRDQFLSWEPALIESARNAGVSWAGLAPALGVTSRQAAERRYLRLRPSQEAGLTGEERVQATRDERAGDRAVAAWARQNALELRQIAGQVTTASGLSKSGERRARDVATSLSEDDPASLIEPLADVHEHLVEDHAQLAAKVEAVGRQVSRVRRETQQRRGAAKS